MLYTQVHLLPVANHPVDIQGTPPPDHQLVNTLYLLLPVATLLVLHHILLPDGQLLTPPDLPLTPLPLHHHLIPFRAHCHVNNVKLYIQAITKCTHTTSTGSSTAMHV